MMRGAADHSTHEREAKSWCNLERPVNGHTREANVTSPKLFYRAA